MSSIAAHDNSSNALAIAGERISGQAVRDYNIKAAIALSNILKSSLGPLGLDKMLVDSIGDVTISNDGATILKLLEVSHPAAKILCELAQQQDEDVGDGTTSVVILAAELLKRANELVKKKIHPTIIISGYRLACKESVRYITDQLTFKTETLGEACLKSCAMTCLSSKILSIYGEHFAQMAVDAIKAVKTTNSKNQIKYPVKAVNILKAHGQGQMESKLISGFALNCTVACEGMPKYIKDVKIACLDINLQKQRMNLGVAIQIDDPSKLEDVRKREIGIISERIKLILSAGANVVLTSKGIDDLALKIFIEAGALAVRRVLPEDLKRIAKITGATVISTLANLEGGESFEASLLGSAEEVSQERFGDDECIIIKGTKARTSASIILRGSNDQMLDEMERSLHDALCVLKRTLENGTVVPGGGVVETAASVFLESFATTIASREQLAVAEFADALLTIPKTLAINAAIDSTELVSKLRAYHYAAQSSISHDDPRQTVLKCSGLDLTKGTVIDSLTAGILEPTLVKVKSLKSATEAAVAILRIDDFIKMIDTQKAEEH